MSNRDKIGTCPTIRWRRWLNLIFRLAIGIALLFLVLGYTEWDKLFSINQRIEWKWFWATFTLPPLAMLIGVVRWRSLLKAQDINLSFLKLVRYYLHAQFFTMIFPSFLGADAGRSWDVRKETQQTAKGVSSILVERIAGLHMMAGIGLVAAWLTPWTGFYPIIRALILVFFLLVTASVAIILQPWILNLVEKRLSHSGVQNLVRHINETIPVYRQHPLLLFKTWLLSAGVQLCVLLSVYFQIQALGYSHVYFLETISVAVLITITTVIPLSPGALGLQEGGYVLFMGMLGVSATDALLMSVLVRATNIALALWGGLDYLIQGY